MPIANFKQGHIYYEQQGHGENLVLIGGFTADHLVWSEMIEPLSQHYRVLVFDNPGAGRSYTPRENYSLKSMSNDIVSLPDDLGIDHANFMGHSLGASLLMQLCIEHPDKIKKAMLCGGPATVPITAKWQVQGLRYAIEHQLPDDYILLSVFPWLYGRRFLNDKNRVEKLKTRLIENPYPQTLAGFLAQTHVIAEFDISTRLKEIKNECLIVASDEDLLIPMHCLEFLKKNIIHSKLKVIGEGVGHMFHVEEPEQLIKLALNFFAGNHE